MRRFFRYRGQTREDMAEGCMEKMDREFMWWILWEGRTPQKKECFQQMLDLYPEKAVVLRSQKEIDRYLEGLSC